MNRTFRAALCLFLIAVMCGNVGCHFDKNTDRRTITISESDMTKTNLEELSNNEGYFFSECELIADSRLLLVYYNRDYVYQFKIYDLKRQKITGSSEEILPGKRHGKFLHLLNEYFYYFHDSQCLAYDVSCQLVKTIPIADDILRTYDYHCWLSNDLRKMAYVKNDGTAYRLYWSDTDGANEECLQPVSVDLSPEETIFSQDGSTIGFWGCAIPTGKSDSMDCYGYIIPADGIMQLYYRDNTHAEFRGDTLLILKDFPINPGAPREGKVRTLDLSDKKHAVITTNYADECEWAVLGSDTRYTVGVHLDEQNLTLYFTIYKDGKMVKEIGYQCQSDEKFTDLSGSTIWFDVATNQIIVFYYDTALGKNRLISVPTE